MEAEWMKKNISNHTICNWFYIFFLANVIVIALIVLVGLYSLLSKGVSRVFTSGHFFLALLQMIVAGTNMLFFFLICDRSLQAAK